MRNFRMVYDVHLVYDHHIPPSRWADRAHCIRDLAEGLANTFEAEPSLVGPLIGDYQFVAGELLDAYRAVCDS